MKNHKRYYIYILNQNDKFYYTSSSSIYDIKFSSSLYQAVEYINPNEVLTVIKKIIIFNPHLRYKKEDFYIEKFDNDFNAPLRTSLKTFERNIKINNIKKSLKKL